MRLRHITGSEDMVAGSEFVTHEPEKLKGSWASDVFHNDQERVQIYQLMLIIIIAGLAVSGLIFYAESRRTSEVPQEKDS